MELTSMRHGHTYTQCCMKLKLKIVTFHYYSVAALALTVDREARLAAFVEDVELIALGLNCNFGAVRLPDEALRIVQCVPGVGLRLSLRRRPDHWAFRRKGDDGRYA